MIDFQKKKKVDMSLSPENDPPNIRTKKKKGAQSQNNRFLFWLYFCHLLVPLPPTPPRDDKHSHRRVSLIPVSLTMYIWEQVLASANSRFRPMLTDDTNGDGIGNVSLQYVPQLTPKILKDPSLDPNQAISPLKINYQVKLDTTFYPTAIRTTNCGPPVNDIILGIIHNSTNTNSWDAYITEVQQVI